MGKAVTGSTALVPADKVLRQFAALHGEAKELLRRCSGLPDNALVFKLVELERRAWQLNDLLVEIRRSEELAANALSSLSMCPGPINNETVTFIQESYRRVEMYAECFYVLAFRVVELAARIQSLKFDPKGVRLVRNHLIVHPEKQRGFLGESFGAGGETGPILKGFRQDADSEHYNDQGLWINADQFARLLRRRINACPLGQDAPRDSA